MTALRLAISPTAGAELIQEYDLLIEASCFSLEDPQWETPGMLERVVSVHGPIGFEKDAPDGYPNLRVHIASTREELRNASLTYHEKHIRSSRARFPSLRKINIHAAPSNQYFDPPVSPHKNALADGDTFPPDTSSWDSLVESLRKLSKICAELDLTLTVENNWSYWSGVDEATPVQEVDFERLPAYWCSDPDQWLKLPKDVSEANFKVCLDPSHATPYAQRSASIEERHEVMKRYLSDFEALGHVHWNDSDIETNRGRDDLHLPIGEGSLGDSFHAGIKRWALQQGQIPLLEHFYDRERLERELEYIAGLSVE